MPIYDYSCECGNRLIDQWAGINDRTTPCPECHRPMTRDIGNPRISIWPPTGGYYDETLDKHIETKSQWTRECREQGVTPRGDTPKPEDRA
jgi:putative FmdB family regulatory protein